jgi:hypothetical protein
MPGSTIRNRGSSVKLRDSKDSLGSQDTVRTVRSSWSHYRNFILLAIACTTSVSFFFYSGTSYYEPSGTYGICTKTGANIYTVDDSLPRAECVVVRDQHIAAVGSLGEAYLKLWKITILHNLALFFQMRSTPNGKKFLFILLMVLFILV